MRIVIIEDEKPSARYLQRLLKQEGINAEAVLHSVEDAILWFKENKHPDLIFLDIQLSDGLSFQIFDAIKIQSAIIFTTAYDEYALQAFKLNSVDYLLKPIDSSELNNALTKFKTISPKQASVQIQDLKQLLSANIQQQFKERFSVTIGQRIKLIEVKDVELVYSLKKGTYLKTYSGRDYLVDFSLSEMEELLNPEQFFRINRKYIISIDAIVDIISHSNSRLKLKVKGLEQDLIVARERVKDFKQWLG